MKTTSDSIAKAGRILLGAAALTSLYLAAMALSRTSLPGCGEATGCQDVMESRWAYAFGIPVSFAGLVLYVIVLLASGSYVRRERTVTGLLGGVAISAALAGAVWFTVLQVFAMHSICLWCSLTHGSAVAGALLLRHSRARLSCSRIRRDAGGPLPNERVFRFTATGAALTGVGLLALGSFSGPAVRPGGAAQITPAAPAVVPAAGGSLALMGGKFQINPADYPVIGSAKENALTAVLLSDFTCEWCLKYHSILENVTASAGQDVRILVLPIARSPQAGDIQRTLLTVFHAAPEAWHRLAALISSGQITATPDAVGRAALSLIGSDKFAAAAQLHADKIQEQLQLAADVLAGSRGRGETAVLPQLFSGSRVLTGAESDPAKVVAFLRDNSPPAPRPDPHPVLALLTESVDLDALLPGKPRDFRVKLQNRGDAVLNIGWLALDEGCEVTSMPDKKVHPGEVAVIGLRLKPRAEGGNFTRRLQIHSDAPGGPSPINLHCRCAPSVAAASAP